MSVFALEIVTESQDPHTFQATLVEGCSEHLANKKGKSSYVLCHQMPQTIEYALLHCPFCRITRPHMRVPLRLEAITHIRAIQRVELVLGIDNSSHITAETKHRFLLQAYHLPRLHLAY